ncbi:uncharacterized protein LOC122079200 [Macadamia integrifolia]|uniref:uncharacterized protein LOC122079200 n=1 Tax=Macadamia integrifolia TaxID=60698 RepID=UPI001C4F0D1E|nr:uncharacterized protein LOC122079200 [Macadamia integrifolia]
MGRGFSGQSSDRTDCRCTYYGKPKHTVETCWAKHGKPKLTTQLANHTVSDDGTDTVSPATTTPTPASGDSSTSMRDDINQLLRRLHSLEASSNTSMVPPLPLLPLRIQDLHSRKTIDGGCEKDGLYYLNSGCLPTSVAATAVGDVSPFQWHCCLGHLALPRLQLLFPSFLHISTLECEACELGKHHQVSFPYRSVSHSPSFSLVHSDIWGPCRVSNRFGFRYFVTFVDDHSCLT